MRRSQAHSLKGCRKPEGHVCAGGTTTCQQPLQLQEAPRRRGCAPSMAITPSAQRFVEHFNCPEIIRNLFSEQNWKPKKSQRLNKLFQNLPHLFHGDGDLQKINIRYNFSSLR